MDADPSMAATLRGLGRILPDLPSLSDQRVLILGIGTLGCSIARGLLSYGCIHQALVDFSIVRPSNPHRQSLYTMEDIGQPKAVVAAKALTLISKAAVPTGHQLFIPTPGRGHPSGSHASQVNDLIKLVELIELADSVFICTDTRGSRFSPSLICAALHVACFSVAIGTDHLIVVRHGLAPELGGCYFCVDPYAQFVSNRANEDTCASTRVGTAAIASALATEMFVNVLAHPAKFRAPQEEERGEEGGSPLGHCPGILRCNVSQNKFFKGLHPSHPLCPCCGHCAQKNFKNGGLAWLMETSLDPTSVLVACQEPPWTSRTGGGGAASSVEED